MLDQLTLAQNLDLPDAFSEKSVALNPKGLIRATFVLGSPGTKYIFSSRDQVRCGPPCVIQQVRCGPTLFFAFSAYSAAWAANVVVETAFAGWNITPNTYVIMES